VAQYEERPTRGVVLPTGHTGSSLFHSLLTQAAAEFPGALGAVELPRSSGSFKREYGEILARFESARVVAPERVDIARYLVKKSQASLEFAEADRRIPLDEYLTTTVASPTFTSVQLGAADGFRPELTFDGQIHRGRSVCAVADRMVEAHHMTKAARDALHWIVQHVESQGGSLDLRGQNFVVLGAGAELAATRMLLAAGARVLFIDVAEPTKLLASSAGLSGMLVTPSTGGNLLEQPREVLAAIRGFAQEHGPVHLSMFAYASGSSQEWRLGSAMTAIATHLPADALQSVTMLVSPTTAASLQPESLEAAKAGLRTGARWKTALWRTGLLGAPGHFSGHGAAIARATVSIQGLSYQAAQYIAKLAAAETFAVYGNDLGAVKRRPLTVSANVAGITRTRSLAHPLFQAAFIGAPHFGVRIFDPAETRGLSGLLILHDLLNRAAPGSASVQPGDVRKKASGLLSQQVHGGIYSLPYVLEHAIRIAAVIGMGRKPSLLLGGKPAKPPGLIDQAPA
jgi:hypothetical protein